MQAFTFGIVAEATFKVYDTTYNGEVLEGDTLFPASVNRSIFEIMASYDETPPAELSLTAFSSYNSTIDKLIRRLSDTKIPRLLTISYSWLSIILNIVYYGPQEKAMPYIQPLLELAPTVTNMTMVPWNRLYATVFFGADATTCEGRQYLTSTGQRS